MLRALGYLWSGPTTLLMVLVWLLPAWGLGWLRPWCWQGGTWAWAIQSPSWLAAHYSRAGWTGTTFGWAIMYSPGCLDSPVWRAHEERHAQQASILGPLFLPVWLILTLFCGYRANPLEVDARRAAGQE